MKIAVIGGGPGGYVAALTAVKKGAEVVLIEKEHLGGTCLNKGCIPTKTLLHSANLYNETKEFANLGINTEGVSIDFSKITERKTKIVAQLRKGVEYLLAKGKVEVITGEASFATKDTLTVATKGEMLTINADSIIIATGSVPSQIPLAEVNHKNIINSDSALELDNLPKSMVIVGGGVIGCEFAQCFARLGCKVTLIEMLPALIDTMDADLKETLKRALKKDGVDVELSSRLTQAEDKTTEVEVIYINAEGKEKRVVAEKLFVATGRTPNTQGLNLENANIEYTNKGIKTDKHMGTNTKNIYAIGDVTGGIQLAHVASHQGVIAVNNIFGGNDEFDDTAIPYCIYTNPEIASMGLTEKMATKMGIEVKTGTFPVSANGRALIEGCKDGLSKVVLSREDDTVLGVHLAAPNATEMVSLLSGIIKFGATAFDVEEWIFAHPSVSEIIHESVLDANKKAIHK